MSFFIPNPDKPKPQCLALHKTVKIVKLDFAKGNGSGAGGGDNAQFQNKPPPSQ